MKNLLSKISLWIVTWRWGTSYPWNKFGISMVILILFVALTILGITLTEFGVLP